MRYKVQLAVSTIGPKDIDEAIACLKSGNLTMGQKVREFEAKFAQYIGAKDAVMVNSGSSANLLALFAFSNPFINKHLSPGDEVIVPAVTWSTTAFPVIQAGCVPVFVDCDQDYQIDTQKLDELITNKTKAIIPTHILGNVCNMDEITKIAKDHELYVLEDSCEALGAKYGNKYVGTIGDIGTYSFYFSHHITTIEGGMVVSTNEELLDTIRVMRHHGLVRDSSKKAEYIKNFPNIDPRFMFVNMGFNLRPTELNAVLGITQLDKLDGIIETRKRNAKMLIEALQRYEDYLLLPREKPNTSHSWFAFPITVKPNSLFKREDLMNFMEKASIETRPLIAGNLVEHPVFLSGKIPFKKGNLDTAENVMRNSFYFGVHQDVDVQYVIDVFDNFFKQFKI